MKDVIICCEGDTEELFVEKILAPHLKQSGLLVNLRGMKGVSSYKKIKEFLIGYCQSYPRSLVTTMIDYYGTARLVPEYIQNEGDIYSRALAIEATVEKDLHQFKNLMFNLTLHEFEGYLFSNTEAFEDIANKSQLAELENIRRRVETPEHINNKYETAPSRRILNVIPDYSKKQDGIEIARRIGVEKIALECRHFADWLAKLTTWARDGAQ